MLENFKKEKNEVLKVYDYVAGLNNFFPVEAYSDSEKPILKDDVLLKKDELKNEKFYVSFTGQIKAGKSTLINALIFEDEILPSDPTPHTAKITLLRYADKPLIEVIFYNNSEWNELLKDSDFKKIIEKDVQESAEKGVLKVEYVKSSSLGKKDNIENLKEYVAKEGKYTPFVKEVTVYYPSDILKDVIVVDTPGVNDPNKVRDRVAKDWIGKSNANLYIIYAGQAFSETDIEFMDKYLLSIPKNQKITVINKIDTVEDLDSLENYVSTLRNDEDLKNREIFDADSSIVYVSSLGALIDKILDSGKELDEDLEFYAEELEDKGFLSQDKYKLNDVKKAIEVKLIQNKGANLLKSHKKYLSSLFDKKITIRDKKLKELEDSVKNLSMNKEDLDGKKRVIEEMQIKLNELLNKHRILIKKKVKEITANFNENTHNKIYKVRENIKNRIDNINEIKKLKNIPGELKDQLRDATIEISNDLLEKRDIVLNSVKYHMDDVMRELKKVDNAESVSLDLLEYEVFVGINDLKDQIDNVTKNFDGENFYNQHLDQYKHWFGSDDIIGARVELKEYISNKIIEKVLEQYFTLFENSITKKVSQSGIGSIEEAIRKSLDNQETRLDEVLSKLDEREKELKETKVEMNKVKEEILTINNLKSKLNI